MAQQDESDIDIAVEHIHYGIKCFLYRKCVISNLIECIHAINVLPQKGHDINNCMLYTLILFNTFLNWISRINA